MKETEFDQYAKDYQDLVDASIRISGESSAHFARQRIMYLRSLMERFATKADRVLDYGCGIGSAAPVLQDVLAAHTVVGVDISADSIERARRDHKAATFERVDAFCPAADIDLCYTSCVFHHIRPSDRPQAMATIRNALRPGGLLALWEQNPFNPGTRWAMDHCAFDADAVTLTPATGRRLLRDNGFDVLATRFLFIFPRALKAFRFIEPKVSRLPIGAQYLVLGRKI